MELPSFHDFLAAKMTFDLHRSNWILVLIKVDQTVKHQVNSSFTCKLLHFIPDFHPYCWRRTLTCTELNRVLVLWSKITKRKKFMYTLFFSYSACFQTLTSTDLQNSSAYTIWGYLWHYLNCNTCLKNDSNWVWLHTIV